MGFSAAYQKKKGRVPSAPSKIETLKSRIENGLAIDSGSERTKSRDPVYHITQSFLSVFDSTGKSNAELLDAEDSFSRTTGWEGSSGFDKFHQTDGASAGIREGYPGEPESGAGNVSPYRAAGQKQADGLHQEQGNHFYRKFADTAFNNGRLAASVLRDGGRNMFVSCLKRTLGQSEPVDSRQSNLFSDSSVELPVKNMSGRVVFNRYAKSAVGLVADSILSARQVLKLFEQMASGDAGRFAAGADPQTLRTVYPFLDMSGEEARIQEYRNMQLQLTLREQASGNHEEQKDIAAKKALLEAGMTKTTALIAKKRQMRQQFLEHLEKLLESSEKAEEMFTSPGFAEEIAEELTNPEEPPPDDDGKGKGRRRGKPGKPGTGPDGSDHPGETK